MAQKAFALATIFAALSSGIIAHVANTAEQSPFPNVDRVLPSFSSEMRATYDKYGCRHSCVHRNDPVWFEYDLDPR